MIMIPNVVSKRRLPRLPSGIFRSLGIIPIHALLTHRCFPNRRSSQRLECVWCPLVTFCLITCGWGWQPPIAWTPTNELLRGGKLVYKTGGVHCRNASGFSWPLIRAPCSSGGAHLRDEQVKGQRVAHPACFNGFVSLGQGFVERTQLLEREASGLSQGLLDHEFV